ncbi:LysR family transcriptional regulator [Streptomyces sp. NPDC058092]|uniref:LysR family transcriptional regulator n=1 Tax=Streptomyces sp. NPDC058092 TaxID=3346336 RepID=UPI0036E5A609
MGSRKTYGGPPSRESRSGQLAHGVRSAGTRAGSTIRGPTGAYLSLGEAASGLGLNTFTLVAQINRIERELGGPLLVRAERGRPMTLTPLGRRVLRAIRTSQDGAKS